MCSRYATSSAARASAAGVSPVEHLVDLLLGDEGRALLYLPFLNYFDGDLDAVISSLVDADTAAKLAGSDA